MWRQFLWAAYQMLWTWKGISIDMIRALGELQQWLSKGATMLERRLMQEREEQLRVKLEDAYPGSAGLLHRICKWKAAWQPRVGSVTKKALPHGPQEAAGHLERAKQVENVHAQ